MRIGWILAAFAIAAMTLPTMAGEQGAPAPAANTLEAIAQRLVAVRLDMEVDKQDPDKVLDLVRDGAKVNIVVEPAARREMEGKTVSLKLKGVTALTVLQQVLRQLNLVSTYGDEALIVTTAEAAKPAPQMTVYDIRDLTATTRSYRVPPDVFGSQIDMVYYYWLRTQIGPRAGARPDPFWEFDLLDHYPPEQIGEAIAETLTERLGKDSGVSVTYRDGFLIVITQPKAARVPVAVEPEQPTATSAK